MVAICLLISICGCGNSKKINGTIFDTYGFLNESEKKNPAIEYELIIGNVVWGILLCESLVFPIYFFGFSLYEPVALKVNI